MPRCTCGGGGGCGFGLDWGGGCSFGDSTCPDVVPAGTHTISVSGAWGGCDLQCEPGWSDCNNNPNDGCETAGQCPDASFKPDGGAKPELLQTLDGAPRGLVACGSLLYYFDDAQLDVIDTSTAMMAPVLASSGVPTGGLACDGSNVYWTTLADWDAGTPNGAVWSLPLNQIVPTALASGVDPGVGIDTRSSRVYWVARSGFGDAGSMLAYSIGDAGSFFVMPAVETEAYKAFALSSDGDYALASGSIWFNPLDPDAGAAAALPIDASAASGLFAGLGGAYAIVHGPFAFPADAGDAASDAGDDGSADATGDALAADASTDAADEAGEAGDAAPEAGAPSDTLLRVGPDQAELYSGLGRIVATAGNGNAVVASDDTLYLVRLPAGTVTVLARPVLHVADVTLDTKYAYWTTRGQGTLPAGVWRIALP